MNLHEKFPRFVFDEIGEEFCREFTAEKGVCYALTPNNIIAVYADPYAVESSRDDCMCHQSVSYRLYPLRLFSHCITEVEAKSDTDLSGKNLFEGNDFVSGIKVKLLIFYSFLKPLWLLGS